MASLGTGVSPSAAYPRQTPLDAALSNRRVPGSLFGRRQWLLVAADLSWILSGALLMIALRFRAVAGRASAFNTLTAHLGICCLFAVLVVLFCHTQEIYSVYRPVSRYQESVAIFKSILMAAILLGGSLFVSGIKSASRLVIFATAVYSLVFMVGWRLFRRWSAGKAIADGLSCHNVMIIGTNPVALALAEHLSRNTHLGFVVLGHLGPAPDGLDSFGKTPKILGEPNDLKVLCRAHFADEVVICTSHRLTAMQAISDARECGLGVQVIPDLFDGMAFGAQLHYLGDFPSLAVVHRSVPAIAMKLKRVIDVVASAVALVLLSPLLLALAIIIKLDSRGPVFYVSRRVGKKGRIFSCYKFRTMVTDAERLKKDLQHLNEREGILFKIANDPRITRVGRVLRKYSLDEFAQLWNVLKGDMSLVGPRPPLINEFEQYQLEYMRRLEAAPGITGLWQIEARNHPSFDRYISLDLRYVENWSLALDMQILFRTIAVVFAGTGT